MKSAASAPAAPVKIRFADFDAAKLYNAPALERCRFPRAGANFFAAGWRRGFCRFFCTADAGSIDIRVPDCALLLPVPALLNQKSPRQSSTPNVS
jgi:hypothetical protein